MRFDGSRKGVVTAGSWCADHNKFVEFWPEEEGLVEILSEEIRGGGSACNMAIDLKRLDPSFPVSAITLVGDDADGDLLVHQARVEGVDCTGFQRISGERTMFTDAFTAQDTARRTHLFHAGTGSLITPDHIDLSGSTARFLHLGLPGLHKRLDSPWGDDANGWVTVLKRAQALGIRTNLELCSLPPERLRAIVLPCLPHLDCLIVNDFEIAALARKAKDHREKTNVDVCMENARLILDRYTMDLVVVHFPHGAVAVHRDGRDASSTSVNVPEKDVIGTNGAGDAFAAGVLYALHEGRDLLEMLRLGHAAAAASIRSLGTTDAVTGWQECLALAEHYGWRADA